MNFPETVQIRVIEQQTDESAEALQDRVNTILTDLLQDHKRVVVNLMSNLEKPMRLVAVHVPAPTPQPQMPMGGYPVMIPPELLRQR